MSIRHITLRQLAVFEAAARRLSFTRAAEQLHLTPPAVSMQIKELERAAGVPLFEREGRAVRLTDAGHALLVHARDILRTLDDAQNALDALKGLRGGRVAIGVTSTAKYFAPQLLARFRKRHPDVELRLAVSNRGTVVEQLAGNAVDLAIMGRPPSALDMAGAPFAPHPFVVIAAPDHPLAGRTRVALATLVREPFLVREPGSGTRTAMEEFFADRRAKVRADMEIASNETIKQAVMAGMGVSFISRHTVSFELRAGRLATIGVPGLPLIREWYVVHRVKRLSPAALAFKAFALEEGRDIVRRHFDE